MNIFQNFPDKLLKQLYTRGTLRRKNDGVAFSLKNRLIDIWVTEICEVTVNSTNIGLDNMLLQKGKERIEAAKISKDNPLEFPLKQTLEVFFHLGATSQAEVSIKLKVKKYGTLKFRFSDKIREEMDNASSRQDTIIRKSGLEDFSFEVIEERLQFVKEYSNTELSYITDYSHSPGVYKKSCENFIGTSHVPIGVAGPVKVNGNKAKGEFLIPMATTEGTLIASYNRGMKLVNLCGGVNTIVVEDLMQRAPVFVLSSALTANKFANWVKDQFDPIKEQAESSSNHTKLVKIESYESNKFVFLRFDYTTGDASGQNMVNKATLIACNWIIGQYKHGIEHFYLESNMATDKKPSFINTLNTRGKKVTADLVVKRSVLNDVMRVEPSDINCHESVANIGAFLSGTNNNGLHSSNALAAIFVATGQDVACLAESSSCIAYSEVLPNGDLYASLTLPTLVVATHGGGTGLPTQKECLEIMKCTQPGDAYKLAEIIAAVVVAGELSLACAISSLDWVVSHEEMGR